MTTGRSETLFRKRVRKFRRIKRGYYSFLLIAGALCLFVVWFLNLRLVTEVHPDALVIRFPLLWPSRRIPLA